MCLTIYFDGTFWVGIIEETECGVTRAWRHVFGAEPGDARVLEFVRREVLPLFPPDGADAAAGISPSSAPPPREGNPKRREREAARAIARHGGSTMAREALSRQREEQAEAGRSERKRDREEERNRRREIARMKAKKRHKGH